MTKAEITLAGRLLIRASEEFSQHGCNDLDEELTQGMSEEDKKAIADSYNRWNDPTGVDTAPFEWLGDSSLMHYLGSLMTEGAAK